ncbi:universal stress protein [Paeniglutamicibacter gangotriensis]|uniref:UspA domain-containing protein n=1 Tax=Paeniglutamicibacter gangotriensis Lz1y TaxID=1276920 RepID=M7MM58_9MICC|nr:universal stress protein [Paeniglutamicibacter gangotriensis]EMQ97412.1 UspA domain-containing protein [Paeniglutamicibacter gangotriensis Lz1y]
MGRTSGTPTIVVGVDGSDASLEALRQARYLATSLNARIEAIGCWENPRMYDGYVVMGIDGFRESAEKVVTQAVRSVFGPETPPNLQISLVQGNPKTSLVKASRNADFLIVGRRGHGKMGQLLIGSVSASCIAHAKCPVLVVHTPQDDESH